MKSYKKTNHLRLVGQAWEVRAWLRDMLDRNPYRDISLSVWLSHVTGDTYQNLNQKSWETKQRSFSLDSTD